MTASEDIEQLHDSTEFRQVRDFIAGGHALDEHNFENVPFAKESFTRFCNVMISVHCDTIIRREDGITVSGEGVEVRTSRSQNRMVFTAAPSPML